MSPLTNKLLYNIFFHITKNQFTGIHFSGGDHLTSIQPVLINSTLRLTKKLVETYWRNISIDYNDLQTIEERRAVAGEGQTALQYSIRTYVDEMDDRVNDTYAAWPTRLYLVDLDGVVFYAGGLEPWGLKPRELKDAMDD